MTCETNGGRGKFVEIISAPARLMAPKPLKKMVVCAVRYEPVSDPTTGINRANSRIRALFVIYRSKLSLCRRGFCEKFPCKGLGNLFAGQREFVWAEPENNSNARAGVRLRLASPDRGLVSAHRSAAVPVLDF